MITREVILASSRIIKSFGQQDAENNVSDIVDIPYPKDKLVILKIEKGSIEKEDKKIDDHVNAKARHDPKVTLLVLRIVLIAELVKIKLDAVKEK
jgi:hypothetical protein